MDITHDRTGARGADGEMREAIDYHSKFPRICYSGDIDTCLPEDCNIDSLSDAVKVYHYLTVLQEKWKCAGNGKHIFHCMCMLIADCFVRRTRL